MLVFLQHYLLISLRVLKFLPTIFASDCLTGFLVDLVPITLFQFDQYHFSEKLPNDCSTIFRSSY